MATSAAPAPASSGQGRGSSSAADDPPDPSAAWYLTKAQLERTPARRALLQKFGQDAEKAKEKEAQYRRLTVGFLQEAGQKLRLCVPRPARGPCAPLVGAAVVGEQGHGARALLGICTRCPVGPGNVAPIPKSPTHGARGPPRSLCRAVAAARLAQATAEHRDRDRLLPPLLLAPVVRLLRPLPRRDDLPLPRRQGRGDAQEDQGRRHRDAPSSRLTRRPPSPAAAPHGHPCHSHGPGRSPASWPVAPVPSNPQARPPKAAPD